MDVMQGGPRLACSGLAMEYRNARSGERVPALGPIDLEIAAGEFLAVVGPSGCGKSTLLSIIAGLVTPTAGGVQLDGRPISGPGPERGVCFQDYALFPWMTVLENIAFGPKARGWPRERRHAHARDLIERVGLTGFEGRFPHELSGGMRQRCALARVLANDPQVLLMDEPMAALDAQTRQLMQDDLLRVWGEGPERKTVIYVTHSIEEAVYLADRIVVMSSRPGLIKADLPNDFPRPRSDIKTRAEFGLRVDQIWNLIRGDALRALAQGEH